MDPDLSLRTLRALRRVLRRTVIGNRQLAASTGLTPSQLLVLREIRARGEATPGAIARALHFSQATITIIVDRLEERGYVERRRSDHDRRQSCLLLLAAGEALLDDAPDPLQTVFAKGFAELPDWEQAMILAAVERLSMLVGAEAIDAAPLLDGGRIDRAGPD